MKITCSQEELNRGLGIVGKAVTTRTTLPVLNNVLLSTDGERLKLTATNLEIGITCWIACQVEREGAITIPARLLQEFVSNLPNDRVTIDVNESNYNIHLTCARYDANIRGIDSDEFPTLPKLSGAPLARIPWTLLREMVSQVSFSASRDDSRPQLAGVLISFKRNSLLMASSDGFRLSQRTAQLEEPAGSENEVQIIVPVRAMDELARVLPEAGAGDEDKVEVTVTQNRNQVLFHLGSINLTSRLVEGNFPNYEMIIPKSHTTTTTATTSDFLKAMRIASYFARSNADIVRLRINPSSETTGELTITANASEVGDNQSRLDAIIEGDGHEIAFNAKYVMDVLGVLNTTQVRLESASAGAPGVIKPVGSEEYLHVIMPMHIGSR